MNKKKLLTLVASLTLVGAVGVGATLAYFTDKAEVANVFTMGHVDITLTENEVEPEVDEDGNPTGEYVQKEDETAITEEGLTFEAVVPGQTVPKNPTITATGTSEDCYVRATVTVESEDGISADDLKLLEDALQADITTDVVDVDGVETEVETDWFYVAGEEGETGYYYYKKVLAAGEEAVLFETVTIPGAWDNDVADKNFTIKINAEAIQSVYVEDVVPTDEEGNVTGAWTLGDVTIEEYKAQVEQQ